MARNFKHFIQAFMEYVSYVEAPERFLRWSALSAVAGALERKVWVTNGAATWYPNLYVMLVGDAGSRKSTSSEIAVDLLREVPGIYFLADRLNEASLLARLQSVGKKKTYADGGKDYKHSAAFLYASEAATSFSEMYAGGGIIVTLTDLFNCGPRGWHQNHAWTKHTLKDGEIAIFNPCINLLACSTAAWLTTKVMTKNDAEGGFGSRVLLVVHKGNYRKTFGLKSAGQAEVAMRTKLVQDLTAISKLRGPYSFDEGFDKASAHYDKLHHDQLEHKKANALLSGYQERKWTQAMKLSQVLAASKRDELVLKAEDFEEAWLLLSGLEKDMLEAFGSLSSTPEMKSTNEIWDYICKQQAGGKIVKAQVIAAFQDRMPISQISKTLKELNEAGKILFMPRESTAARMVYAVNDSVQS